MFVVERNLVFWILYFIHRCCKRHVLLKFLYLGWDYQGYATQEDTANTIEHHLFSALVRCCLVETRQTSNYGRCGRTDKGVSSFSQVCLYQTARCHSPDDRSFHKSQWQNTSPDMLVLILSVSVYSSVWGCHKFWPPIIVSEVAPRSYDRNPEYHLLSEEWNPVWMNRQQMLVFSTLWIPWPIGLPHGAGSAVT